MKKRQIKVENDFDDDYSEYSDDNDDLASFDCVSSKL